MAFFTIPIYWRRAIGAALLAAPLLAGAVPAKKGFYTHTTPDGRTLRFERVGGPFSHAIFTDDGIMLSQLEDGTFVYATLDANGMLSPSVVHAHSAECRTAEENSFIARIPQQDLRKALDTKVRNMKAVRSETAGAMAKARAENPGICDNSMPNHTGSPRCLVILAEFLDEKFRTDNPHDYFSRSLNEHNFDSGKWKGSVTDYFTENSKGQFTPVFDVYGPVSLPKTMKYYGENNRNNDDIRPYMMVTDACAILDEETDIDFSVYDNDGDGFVDNVFVIYAGFGESDSKNRPNTIWPHSYDISAAAPNKKYFFDDVRLDHYACTNEVHEVYPGEDDWKLEGIGTFVHEFSHVIGMPDLYETTYSTGSFTPGGYSVLDYGPYNNDGHTPPNYGAYERYALGWLTPDELIASGDYTLEPIADSNKAYIISTERDNEYYLFENRTMTGWDTFIPGEGMLVWHIDYFKQMFDDNRVNNDPNHQYVDIVEADNIRTQDTRPGDIFPGTKNVTSLGFSTTPKLESWARKDLYREFSNIRLENGNVLFTLTNTDQTQGVGNIAEAGEKISWNNGCISSEYDSTITVYDTMGRTAAIIAPASSASLPSGLYIVATPEGTVKIRL